MKRKTVKTILTFVPEKIPEIEYETGEDSTTIYGMEGITQVPRPTSSPV